MSYYALRKLIDNFVHYNINLVLIFYSLYKALIESKLDLNTINSLYYDYIFHKQLLSYTRALRYDHK